MSANREPRTAKRQTPNAKRLPSRFVFDGHGHEKQQESTEDQESVHWYLYAMDLGSGAIYARIAAISVSTRKAERRTREGI
jgi:hypothetical protein